MIKPLGNRIIIEVTEVHEEISKGGVVIPRYQPGQSKMVDYGIVKAVGPGTVNRDGKLVPLNVKVGDKVVFNPHSLQQIKISVDEEYIYIKEPDIIGILEEDN